MLVQVRTSLDGSSWGDWYSAALEVATEGDGSPPQAFTEPLWTGAARYVQVAARQAGGRQAAPPPCAASRSWRSTAPRTPTAGATLLGVVRRTAAAVAGLELAPPAGAMTTKPAIVTRAEWGADESYAHRARRRSRPSRWCSCTTPTAATTTRAPRRRPSCARVYAYHTRSLHWSDVGYNFLIDRYGTVYEGRYGGVTKGAIGAQMLGFNTGSTGVSVIGTFTKAAPPGAAVSALERLLAWKLDVHHVDPQGRATLVCGYGAEVRHRPERDVPRHRRSPRRQLHRLPGGKLYGLLPAIRKAVAAMGQPKIYEFDVAGAYFSPDGDGVRDKAEVAFTVSEAADWSVEIRKPGGDVVRRVSGQGASAAATWNGKDDEGRDLPDGTYTLVASAKSARGEARPATADVHVDTTPPRLESAEVAPSPFSPNGDGQGDSAKVRFAPGESGTARVSVIGDADKVLRRLTDWRRRRRGGAVRRRGTGASARAPSSWRRPKAASPSRSPCATWRATAPRSGVPWSSTARSASPPSPRRPVRRTATASRDTVAVAFKLTRRADVTVALVRGERGAAHHQGRRAGCRRRSRSPGTARSPAAPMRRAASTSCA